jgi:hypothetical protein
MRAVLLVLSSTKDTEKCNTHCGSVDLVLNGGRLLKYRAGASCREAVQMEQRTPFSNNQTEH